MSYGCALLFLGFVQMKSSFSCSIHCSQGRIFAPSLPVPAPILHGFFLTLLLWRVRGKIRQSKELDSWGHFGGHCVNDFQWNCEATYFGIVRNLDPNRRSIERSNPLRLRTNLRNMQRKRMLLPISISDVRHVALVICCFFLFGGLGMLFVFYGYLPVWYVCSPVYVNCL